MLRRNAASLVLAALLCGLAGCSGCGPHAEDVKQAMAASDAWLKLTDQGNYSGAWDQAGAKFKKLFAKDAWVKQITPYRSALGPVRSRTLKSAEYTENIRGQAPGEYVIVKYSTSFANKADAEEEVAVEKESDGVWRSLWYFVRPGSRR